MNDEFLDYRQSEIYKKLKNARIINFRKLIHSEELRKLSEIFENNCEKEKD